MERTVSHIVGLVSVNADICIVVERNKKNEKRNRKSYSTDKQYVKTVIRQSKRKLVRSDQG